MSIIESILNRLGFARKAEPVKYPPWVLERADTEKWAIPDPSLYATQADMYRRISWIQIATAMPAQIAALTPINVYRINGEKQADVPNHAFELLLENPNPLQSRFEFLRDTILYWLLNANSYWYVNASGPDVPPSELWCIPPSQIKVIPDGKSFIEKYEYDPGNGQIVPLQPWQVIHFKDFHPSMLFVGLSKTESIAIDANADRATALYNAKLYGDNNGRLPGIIAFANMIADPDWQVIKQDIAKASKTQNNMLLRGTGSDISWMQASGTVREMETYEGRNFTKEEIYSVFAPGLASMLAVNATEANSKTGKATLIELCVYPLQIAMAEKITQQLLPRYSGGAERLRAQFDDIRISDRALTLQEIAAYSNVHTVNEIREKHYQDDPLPDERGELFPSQVTPPQPAPAPEMTAQPAPVAETMPEPEQEESPADEAEDTAEQESPEVAAEKLRWMRKAINAVKANKPASVHFDTIIIDDEQQALIRKGLAMAETADDVRQVFAANTGARKNIGATPEQVIEMLRLATEALKNV